MGKRIRQDKYMDTTKKFAILLRRGMGLKAKDGKNSIPDIDDDEEWREVILLGRVQTVMGILQRGIRLVPPERRPSEKLYLRSYMQVRRFLC